MVWFLRLYGEIIHSLKLVDYIIDRTGGQTMVCLTCTMKSSVDLALYSTGYLVLKISVSGIVVQEEVASETKM